MDIKKFLHDNGLKQIDLVNYLKISKPFASQLVHGKANLSVPNLNKLISNPYGWDTSALAAPTITARASGNSNASVHIGSGEDVSALRKEIEMLREQLAEEKARSAQYWEMIQKLMK